LHRFGLYLLQLLIQVTLDSYQNLYGCNGPARISYKFWYRLVIAKSIKIGRVSLLFLIDLLVIDLVIISFLLFVTKSPLAQLRLKQIDFISLQIIVLLLFPCLHLVLTMDSVSLAILVQSWSKIACGQGVFNPKESLLVDKIWSRTAIMAAIDPVDPHC
jgi:hypothetical protein